MNKGVSIHCNEILASDKILKKNYSLGTQKISFKWLGCLKEANKTCYFCWRSQNHETNRKDFPYTAVEVANTIWRNKKSFCKTGKAILFSSQNWKLHNWCIVNSCSKQQFPKKSWAGRDAHDRAEMKSSNHKNLRRKFKTFGNIKANMSGGIAKIAAKQLVYCLYVKIGQTQQI